MEITACFAVLAHRDLQLEEFAQEFGRLAMWMELDDAMLNSLFWIGANYHRPVDLPDTIGLSWREGILQESVQPLSGTSPPAAALSSLPSVAPKSSPLSAGKSSLPPSTAYSSPPASLLSSPPAPRVS